MRDMLDASLETTDWKKRDILSPTKETGVGLRMTPKSLGRVRLVDNKTAEQRFRELGPFAARYGNIPKGTVLPESQVQACPRVKVADLPFDLLKKNHIEALEQNQKLASCCRHPENHEVEALKSHPEEQAPDIYIFHCTCGRKHRFFCIGRTDERPFWAA